MAKAKFVGLQQKFERVLRRALAGGGPVGGGEIRASAERDRAEFDITKDELEHLNKNFANYIGRAKDRGVVLSNGPWGGYVLLAPSELVDPQSTAASVADNELASSMPSLVPADEAVGAQKRVNQHWESLLHFPLTVALSQHFKARAYSLPNTSDREVWANPDMLMIRASSRTELSDYFDDDGDADVFRSVDASPDAILSSIELKWSLGRRRDRWFTAIAETAANSRWANESWLIFMDPSGSDERLEDEVLSLARSAEIGVLELRVDRDSNILVLHIHQHAPVRTTLRTRELGAGRQGTLRAARDFLLEWTSEDSNSDDASKSYIAADEAKHKARVLFGQSLDNLRRQKGFTAPESLTERWQPLRVDNESQTLFDRLIKASLSSIANAAQLSDGSDVLDILKLANDETYCVVEAEKIRKDIDTFPRVKVPSRP